MKKLINGSSLKKEVKDKGLEKMLYRTIQRYNIPTSEQYNKLIKLIHIINTELFNRSLPDVMLSFSVNAGKCGKIKNDCWQKDYHKCYEIILNPCITKQTHKELIISLVHSLCHLQLKLANNKIRESYHNTEFAERMRQIGLSTESKEINKESWHTGQKIDITTIKEGKFEKLFDKLKDDDFLPWQIIAETHTNQNESKNNNKNKIEYKCDKCNTKVWGKPGLKINCGNCNNNSFKVTQK